MKASKTDGLLARRLAGEDVATGEPQISNDPIVPVGHPDGDVKLGKSLRVPMGMYGEISKAAKRRGVSWSALVREFIAEGLAREGTDEVDPVVQLHQHLDAATRALKALESQHPAA